MTIQERYQTYIESNKIIKTLNEFLNSNIYLFLIGFITIISNVFALEVICFTLLFILFSLSLLFSKDSKPLITPILTITMAMSYKNGLSYNPNNNQANCYCGNNYEVT